MLSLDSPRWADLRQAYGGAEDVPRLITALSTVDELAPRAELWFALWRMLCHASEVFDAAYAAVPHLLLLSDEHPLGERVQALHLATRVELLRRVPTSPPMPPDLVIAYGESIESLPARVAQCATAPWDIEMAQLLAAALLVGKRQPALARAVLDIGDDDERPADA